ncbi:MAG: coiled-coil domain-containing protein [Leucobacter sp.]
MRTHSGIRFTGVAALAAVLVFSGAMPAIADDYPTWAEVEAAQKSESAKSAEYTKLQSALKQAQTEADSAANKAAETASIAAQAAADLDEVTTREQQLSGEVAESQSQLTESSDEFARLVSWMYMNGTGLATTSQLVSAEDPEDYMKKLSIVTQVSNTWDNMASKAANELNTASSLQEQATVAKAERDRLSKAANTAAADAASAQAIAAAAVATADDRLDTVYEQLASLKGTTAEVERRYQIGLQVAEQASNQGGGSGGGSGGWVGGGGVSVDPAGHQAYARSQLGNYGWGDDQFSCLLPLWTGESDWRADALNASSGAYGIPQSLPAEKLATAGADWRTNGRTQVDWGLSYIQQRYGSPCNAWSFWQGNNPHWY